MPRQFEFVSDTSRRISLLLPVFTLGVVRSQAPFHVEVEHGLGIVPIWSDEELIEAFLKRFKFGRILARLDFSSCFSLANHLGSCPAHVRRIAINPTARRLSKAPSADIETVITLLERRSHAMYGKPRWLSASDPVIQTYDDWLDNQVDILAGATS